MSGRQFKVAVRRPGEQLSEDKWQQLKFYVGSNFLVGSTPWMLKRSEPERQRSSDEILVKLLGEPWLLRFESGTEAEAFLAEWASRASRGNKRKAPDEPAAAADPRAPAEQTPGRAPAAPAAGEGRPPGRDVSDDYGRFSKHSSLPHQGKQVRMSWEARQDDTPHQPSAGRNSTDLKVRAVHPWEDRPDDAPHQLSTGWSSLDLKVMNMASPQRPTFTSGGSRAVRIADRPTTFRRPPAPPTRSQDYSSFREQPAFRQAVQDQRGLRNLGNTCYLNAVAQSLGSLREFAATLVSTPQAVSAMGKGELFLRTTELLERMSCQVQAQGPISPTQLRERIAKQAPMFGGFGQQDAHEFFLEWVNQLHDEMLAASEQWAHEDPALCDERVDTLRGLALATQKHFDSELQKRLVCEKCGDHRDVHERFRDFSLDFDKGQSDSPLEFMLKSYFAEERLEAKCERCGGDSARMEKTLTSAPRVLVLHLKRFVPNTLKQRYEKQHGSVLIPAELDLAQCVGAQAARATPVGSPQRPPARPLVSEAGGAAVTPSAALPGAEGHLSETPPPRATGMDVEAGGVATPPPPAAVATRGQTALAQAPKERDAAPQEAGLVYDLRAVVAHEGASPHQGHYVSYARSEKGAWRLYDDAEVKDVGSNPAAELGRRAYILFYVMRSTTCG